MKKPGEVLPAKTSPFSSQAIPSMIRIRARKAKAPAAMPTTEPRSSLATFSVTSALASSNSSRISDEVPVETSKTRSATDFFSASDPGAGARGGLIGGGVWLGSGMSLLRGVFVEDAAPDHGGEPGGGDAGKRTAGGKHAAPEQSSDHLVFHTRLRPYLSRLEAVTDRRHHKFLGLVEVCVGGGDEVEDPAREQLLDRPVEGHRGEHRRHVVAEGAGGLAVLDDLGDRLVGAADLRQVGTPEGI